MFCIICLIFADCTRKFLVIVLSVLAGLNVKEIMQGNSEDANYFNKELRSFRNGVMSGQMKFFTSPALLAAIKI